MKLSLKSERNLPTAFGYVLWQTVLYCSSDAQLGLLSQSSLKVFYLRTLPFLLECSFLYIPYLFPQALKGS